MTSCRRSKKLQRASTSFSAVSSGGTEPLVPSERDSDSDDAMPPPPVDTVHVPNSINFANVTPTQEQVKITYSFLLMAMAMCGIIAFAIGSAARILLLSMHGLSPSLHASIHFNAGNSDTRRPMKLPPPTIIPGKEVPYTTYTSKTFQMAGSATSNTLHIDRRSTALKTSIDDFDDDKKCKGNDLGWVACEDPDLTKCTNSSGPPPKAANQHNDDADGIHFPAGQHLLIDIKDVDSSFLNSEERVATAMIELINESKLTLLSYHCHSLVPIGVSCAGVLLESHVAFHTWYVVLSDTD
eukprot:scaffold2107_cov192-Alexandrium_tamarense.AAC.56